jgi:uncharacterized OB-fold protein
VKKKEHRHYQPGSDPRSWKYFEPKKSGKLKAYCKECGNMIMQGEDVCTKCKCTEFVQSSPKQATVGPQKVIYLRGP